MLALGRNSPLALETTVPEIARSCAVTFVAESMNAAKMREMKRVQTFIPLSYLVNKMRMNSSRISQFYDADDRAGFFLKAVEEDNIYCTAEILQFRRFDA
jgi:hypothetical protein